MFREKWVIERNIKCTNKSGHTDTARSCVVGCVWELQGLIFISKQTLFNKLKRMTRQTV